MPSTTKRLDLRFGAFACSVQGFDDPVQPVQQILRAIQHLLEESPELADAGINFDAEAIEQLVGEVARRADLDEREVEIVPGLVIIQHGAGGEVAARPAEAPAEMPAEAAWSAGEEKDEGGGEGYVNIFAAGGNGAAEEEASAEEAEPTEEFADRLRRMARGSDADYGWRDDEEGGGPPVWPYEPEAAAEEDSAAEDGTAEDGAAEDGAAEDGAAEDGAAEDGAAEDAERNLFAADAVVEDEPGAVHNLFASAAADEDEEDDWRLTPAAEEAAEEAASDEPADEGHTAASLAERAGARAVPELMVASAAFMVLMRGQTSFKRRDVLDVFETLPGEHDKSLEAQIKGFGKAVRNGQLVTVEDGIFGLARAELERYQGLL